VRECGASGAGKKQLTTHRSAAPLQQLLPPFNFFSIDFGLLAFYRNLNMRTNQQH
jgi:hypothetical protein